MITRGIIIFSVLLAPLAGSNGCERFIEKQLSYYGTCNVPYHESERGMYYQLHKDDMLFMLLVSDEETNMDPNAIDKVLLRSIVASTSSGYKYYLFAQDNFVPLNAFYSPGSTIDVFNLFKRVIEKIIELHELKAAPITIKADTVFVNTQSKEVRLLEFRSIDSKDAESLKKQEYMELMGFYNSLIHYTVPFFSENQTPQSINSFKNKFEHLNSYMNKLEFNTYDPKEILQHVKSFISYLDSESPNSKETDIVFKMKAGHKLNHDLEGNDENLDGINDVRHAMLFCTLAFLIVVALVITIIFMSMKTENIPEDDFEKRVIQKPIARIVYE